MKAYVIVTGLIFAALFFAHMVKLGMEGTQLLHDPAFVVFTAIFAALAAWAWRVFPQMKRC